MLGNTGDLVVKFMQQVTKGHLYHLLGVWDYYVMNRHLNIVTFCENDVFPNAHDC